MVNILLILILAIAAFAALFVIPSFMTRRAVFKVVRIFCQAEALDARHARTPDELGLVPPAFFERMTKPRDYKPHALRLLKEANVVHATEDGKLYLAQRELSEELKCSPLVKHQIRAALKKYSRRDA
jgi:hypothetical protein